MEHIHFLRKRNTGLFHFFSEIKKLGQPDCYTNAAIIKSSPSQASRLAARLPAWPVLHGVNRTHYRHFVAINNNSLY